MIKKVILWTAVVLLSLRIFGFSSDTGTESDQVSKSITHVVVNVVMKSVPTVTQREWDAQKLFEICHKVVRKTAHFSIYALLAMLTLLLAHSYDLKVRISAVISASYCLLFAISDEIHQLFVNGRSGQISDVCIDFCGALTGIAVLLLVQWMWKKIKKKNVRASAE